MKNLLYIPTYSGKVHARLLRLVRDRDVDIASCARTMIDEARNKALEIGQKYDYLLFLDDDIIPPKDWIDRLTSHDKDMVTGLYRTRQEDNPLAVYYHDDDTAEYTPYEKIGKFQQVDAAGCGVVAIKGEVCKKMLDEYPRPFEFKDIEYYQTELGFVEMNAKNLFLDPIKPVKPLNIKHRYIGEDIIFFERAKFQGLELRADPDVKCEHIQEFYSLKV